MAVTGKGLAGTTILVVENDVYCARRMIKVLKAARCAVEWRRNGQRTIRSRQKQAPDLIIVDLKTARRDAPDLLEQQAKHGHPVPILVTVRPGENVGRVSSMSASDFIRTPCDGHELLARVARLLEKQLAVDDDTQEPVAATAPDGLVIPPTGLAPGMKLSGLVVQAILSHLPARTYPELRDVLVDRLTLPGPVASGAKMADHTGCTEYSVPRNLRTMFRNERSIVKLVMDAIRTALSYDLGNQGLSMHEAAETAGCGQRVLSDAFEHIVDVSTLEALLALPADEVLACILQALGLDGPASDDRQSRAVE